MKTPRLPLLVALPVVIAASIVLPLIPLCIVIAISALAVVMWERDIRHARADRTED